MAVDSHCPYASNPYHVCGSYCSKRPPRSKVLAVDENLAPKEVGVEENGEVVRGRRNVDPSCGYASNPYHMCTDYCTRRKPNQKSSTNGAKSEGRKEKVMIMKANNVNPSCSYASNPYHKCTKYCSQQTKEMIEIKQAKPERSVRDVGVMGRKDVDPRCKYASNPYHKCTPYCSKKINLVA